MLGKLQGENRVQARMIAVLLAALALAAVAALAALQVLASDVLLL